MLKKVSFLWKTAYRNRMAYGIFVGFLWIFYAVFHFLNIIVLQMLYDNYLKEGYKKGFYIYLLLLGAVLLIDQFFMTMSNVICENDSYIMMKEFGAKLQRVVSRKNTIEFEKSHFQDELARAGEGVENATFFLNVVQMVLLFQIPYLIMVTVYLLEHSIVLPLFFILICIPGGLSRIKKTKIYSGVQGDIAELEREVRIYNDAVYGRKTYRESRFWGTSKYFEKFVDDKLEKMTRIKEKTADKSKKVSIIYNLISCISIFGALLCLIYAVKNGKMTVGIFAAIIVSFKTVMELLESLIGHYWGQLSEQSGNVDFLIDFLQSKDDNEDNVSAMKTVGGGMTLENVSFKYPGSENNVLEDINLSIEQREIIAIVGENGAGKSTLMKVIAGLYQPTTGEINCNSKQKVSFVFQNFQKYIVSFKDNIIFGNDNSMMQYENTLKKVGIDDLSRNLEKGENTILSKEFGGVDLSGGQWQRIAIARGLFPENDIIILDEPTAAIDPMEESRLYELFLKICKGKKAFIVTHRLGICKYVDRILVLKNGRLIEDGSHEELIAKDGEYKKLYYSQAGLYAKIKD